jgi:outer membrane protein assembly factor BamB
MSPTEMPYLERLRGELVESVERASRGEPRSFAPVSRRSRVDLRKATTIVVALALAFAAVAGAAAIFRSERSSRPADEITSSSLPRLGLLWRATIGYHGDPTSVPVVANGMVYVTDYHHLYAFPLVCAASCKPAWTGDIGMSGLYYGAPRLPTPVVADGAVWVESGGEVEAFAEDCIPKAGVCRASWSKPVEEPWWSSLPPVAVSSGTVVIHPPQVRGGGLRAYSTDCADGTGLCRRTWWVQERPHVSAPYLAGDLIVAATGDRVEAFPLDCRPYRAHCAPTWSARQEGRMQGVTVQNGTVTIATHWQTQAFAIDCVGTGSTCRPVDDVNARSIIAGGVRYDVSGYFQPADGPDRMRCSVDGTRCTMLVGKANGAVAAAPIVIDGVVYTTQRDRIVAWPTSCPASERCAPLSEMGASLSAVPKLGLDQAPTVTDGLVYAIASDDRVVAFDPQGCSVERACEPAWSTRIAGEFRSPPVVDDGMLFAVGRTTLFAFGDRGDDAAPPMGGPFPLWIGLVVVTGVAVGIAVWSRRSSRSGPVASALLVIAMTACSPASAPATSAVVRDTAPPPSATAAPAVRGDVVDLDGVPGRFTSERDATDAPAVTIHIVALGPGQPAFSPSVIDASPGERLSVRVVQTDDLSAEYRHNVSIDALAIDRDVPRGPGGRVSFDVTLPASGALVFYCKYHVTEFHAGAFEVS